MTKKNVTSICHFNIVYNIRDWISIINYFKYCLNNWSSLIYLVHSFIQYFQKWSQACIQILFFFYVMYLEFFLKWFSLQRHNRSGKATIYIEKRYNSTNLFINTHLDLFDIWKARNQPEPNFWQICISKFLWDCTIMSFWLNIIYINCLRSR